MSSSELKAFAVELYNIKAIKIGEFTTKVGLTTPVHCDLRVVASYPKLMRKLSDLLIKQIPNLKTVNMIYGVTYSTLPIATVMSLETGIPMVMTREEAVDFGAKKVIEGGCKEGGKCLIIDDILMTGSNILETINEFQNEGIKCTDAVVFLDQDQGGAKVLENNGIKIHAVLTLTDLVEYLFEAKCIDDAKRQMVTKYVSENQVTSAVPKSIPNNRLKMSFLERSRFAKNPIAAQLFNIMSAKQTILCLAADLTDATRILNLAEEVGPYICVLKTHIDIVEDFHPNLIEPLKEIAQRHNFMLFEDRKFADIGKTVELQYSKGLYQISSWASLVTAHSLMGKGILDAIKGAPGLQKRGVFLLAETSASGSLINEEYTQRTLKLACEYPELITGIVCQSPLSDNPGFIQLTPGVKIDSKSDNLGQQYNTPECVVIERGADIAVVGRGITEAKDPVKAAEIYSKALWQAYMKRTV